MSNYIFKDKSLEKLFSDRDPFILAEGIEGKIFRKHANRLTKEFSLGNNIYFIKYHKGVGWKEIIKCLLQFKAPVISAKQEWTALKKLKNLGINCPEPVALVSKGFNPAKINSFIITKSLKDTISLEDLFFKQNELEFTFLNRRKLIKNLATICRKIHSEGINHRDLYLCHFHVPKKLDISEEEVFLIDLHRAQMRKRVPRRWSIKDIGGLFHSAINLGLTERDCYRFLMSYFNLSLREVLTKHKNFVSASRSRAYSMFLNPLIREIDISNQEPFSKELGYIKDDTNNKRWIIKKKYFNKELNKILEDPDSFMKKGRVIKDEKGHFIVSLDLDNYSIIIKKYQIKNLWHFFRKVLSKTRANRAWIASHWFSLAGINTTTHIAIIEKYNFLSTTDSYLISKKHLGTRLDLLEIDKKSSLLIVNKITAFFKRLAWIGFSHGDAKSSNFFLADNKLFTFDLDIAKKQTLKRLMRSSVSKDKKRIVKSFEDNKQISSLLSKRLN